MFPSQDLKPSSISSLKMRRGSGLSSSSSSFAVFAVVAFLLSLVAEPPRTLADPHLPRSRVTVAATNKNGLVLCAKGNRRQGSSYLDCLVAHYSTQEKERAASLENSASFESGYRLSELQSALSGRIDSSELIWTSSESDEIFDTPRGQR